MKRGLIRPSNVLKRLMDISTYFPTPYLLTPIKKRK